MAWTAAEIEVAKRATRAWKLGISPWRDESELLTIRNLLFPAADDPERAHKQQLGVSRVHVWEIRHHQVLPHEILLTKALVEAQLAAADPNVSPRAARDLYAFAFAKFVTGCCDAVKEEKDMVSQARVLGFSDHWVLMRHRIVHRFDTPELKVLAPVVEEALEYLWQKCWSFLTPADKQLAFEPSQYEALLNQYRKERIYEIRNQLSQDENRTSQHTAAGLADGARVDDESLQLLVNVLIPKIFPSNSPPNMDGAFAIWDDLLEALHRANPRFSRQLLDGLMDTLTALDTQAPAQDTKKECAYHWIKNIFKTNRLFEQSSDQHVKQIFFLCLERPTYWSKKLASDLVELMDTCDREHYSEFLSSVICEREVGQDDDNTASAAGILNNSVAKEPTSESIPVQELATWRKYEGVWVPKPFGVL